jgi:hypothetical protein
LAENQLHLAFIQKQFAINAANSTLKADVGVHIDSLVPLSETRSSLCAKTSSSHINPPTANFSF